MKNLKIVHGKPSYTVAMSAENFRGAPLGEVLLGNSETLEGALLIVGAIKNRLEAMGATNYSLYNLGFKVEMDAGAYEAVVDNEIGYSAALNSAYVVVEVVDTVSL